MVVRSEDGEVILFTKGADSALAPLLAPEVAASCTVGSFENLLQLTTTHVTRFATEGLRTLVVARRVIPEDVYQEVGRRPPGFHDDQKRGGGVTSDRDFLSF